MSNFASMTDEDLLTAYYDQEDERKANEAFAELDRRYRPRLILSVTAPGYNKRFLKLHRMPGMVEKGEELAAEALFKVAERFRSRHFGPTKPIAPLCKSLKTRRGLSRLRAGHERENEIAAGQFRSPAARSDPSLAG